MKNRCLYCSSTFVGRTDKKFCTTKCKNAYNYQAQLQKKQTYQAIDTILHQNHRILNHLLNNQQKRIVYRNQLAILGFQFNYHTHTFQNKKGQVYRIVYNFAWLSIQDSKILIVSHP